MSHSCRTALLLFSCLGFALTSELRAQTTQRVSTSTSGGQGNKESAVLSFRGPHPSTGGRFVTFFSKASNLVANDTNNAFDVFVKDTLTGVLDRVSVATGGGEADAESRDPRISPDGRWVIFGSFSRTIIVPHNSSTQDIFLHDRTLATTQILSVPTVGGQANQNCFHADISDDGTKVVFASTATNLVPGDSNLLGDIFLVDVANVAVSRISKSHTGGETDAECRYPDLSGDGSVCVFDSTATNLVPLDTNGASDIFLYDFATSTIELVSLSTTGGQGQGHSIRPCISRDGRFIAFQSPAPDLVIGDTNLETDIFVRDRLNGTLTRASNAHDGSEGLGQSDDVSISADGRFLVFSSSAPNLVPGDTNVVHDVFRRDLLLGTIERISEPAPSGQGNNFSRIGTISPDGSCVGFASTASNLVPADTNGKFDAFLRTPLPAGSTYCTATASAQGCTPQISSSGISSATATSGFVISATNVLSNKPGVLLYGVSGTAAVAFQNATLCVAPPVLRSPVVLSGGALPIDCSGVFSIDMNAFAAGTLGGTPALELAIPGTFVYCQWWSRENTSDAIGYIVGE